MTYRDEVPSWLAYLFRQIRMANDNAYLFSLRGLPDEERAAIADKDELVREVCRRLSELGL